MATSGVPVPRYPVAIVGCGPVGMSVALELNRLGVRCVVLGREPELSPAGSRAIGLVRHTLRAWQRVGAAARLDTPSGAVDADYVGRRRAAQRAPVLRERVVVQRLS